MPDLPRDLTDGWCLLASESAIDDRWLQVDKERLQRPDGVVLDPFWTVHDADWVCVLALRDDGLVPLVEQYRRGADRVTLELPAGDLDPGEDPITAGLRELTEETGHVAVGAASSLGSWPVEPARQTAVGSAIAVRAASHHEPGEVGEGVRLRLLPRAEVVAAVLDGRICHPIHVAAVLIAEQRGWPQTG